MRRTPAPSSSQICETHFTPKLQSSSRYTEYGNFPQTTSSPLTHTPATLTAIRLQIKFSSSMCTKLRAFLPRTPCPHSPPYSDSILSCELYMCVPALSKSNFKLRYNIDFLRVFFSFFLQAPCPSPAFVRRNLI